MFACELEWVLIFTNWFVFIVSNVQTEQLVLDISCIFLLVPFQLPTLLLWAFLYALGWWCSKTGFGTQNSYFKKRLISFHPVLWFKRYILRNNIDRKFYVEANAINIKYATNLDAFSHIRIYLICFEFLSFKINENCAFQHILFVTL